MSDRPVLSGRALARVGVVVALASRILSRLVGLILIVVMARVAPAELISGYGYLLTTAALFGSLTDLGVAAVSGREVASGAAGPWPAMRAALPFQLLSGTVTAAAVVFTTATVGPDGLPASALALAGVFVVANSAVNLCSELLRSAGRVLAEAAVQSLTTVLLVGVGTAIILGDLGLDLLLAVIAGKELLAVLVMVVLLPRRGPQWSHPRGQLLRRSVVVAVAAASLMVLWRQGALIAGAKLDVGTLAVFMVATRLLDAGVTICHIFGVGIMPGLSQMWALDRRDYGRELRRFLVGATLMGLVVGAAGWFSARWLTLLIFGPRWGSATSTVQLIALTGAVMVPLYVVWFGLLAARRERVLVLGTVPAVLVAIALSYTATVLWDTPWAPVLGSAVGAGIALVALAPVLIGLVRRRGRHRVGSVQPVPSAAVDSDNAQ